MIIIPKEIEYAEFYFTLRCNLKCSYCINKYEKIDSSRKELSADIISQAINKIDFKGLPLTIGGGEPTIRKDFYDLMDAIKPEINIDLLTNLQFNVNEFIKKLSPSRFTIGENIAYKSIRVSYHPEQMEPSVLVKKVRKLQDSGFDVGIFGVSHPVNIGANIHLAELARRHEIYFFIKEYLGIYNNQLFGHYKYIDAINSKPKTADCRTSEILIDSFGNIFKCHRDLYHNETPIGNIFDDTPIEYKFRLCHNYGKCNPCDIKNKINKQLNDSRCNVEIKGKG